MTDHENERGALETIQYMTDSRLRYAKARMEVEGLDVERPEEHAALAAEIARRAAYVEATKPELVEAGYSLSKFGDGYRGFLRLPSGTLEALSLVSVGRAETEDEAWAALVRSVKRDPLERPA